MPKRDLGEKKHLTTYQASALVGVTSQTVCNWVDGGKLPAFRTAGGHRRIDRLEFLAFAREHGYTVGQFDSPRALVFAPDNEVTRAVVEQLNSVGIESKSTASEFEAGIEVARFDPSVWIVCAETPNIDLARLMETVREVNRLIPVVIFGPSEVIPDLSRFQQEHSEDCMANLLRELSGVVGEIPVLIL